METQVPKEIHLEASKRLYNKLRLEVLRHYSPSLSCAICGENHYEFLCLDHIEGGGCSYWTSNPSIGRYRFLNDLRRQGFPNGFRVLCHNCNLKHGCRDHYRKGTPRKAESELSRNGRRVYHRAWAAKNRDRVLEYSRVKNHKLKTEVLGHYGGECACCKTNDLDVLSIDHTNGGGTAHRNSMPGQRLGYRWFKSQGFPPGFRVLCMNCNIAYGLYGRCPHAV